MWPFSPDTRLPLSNWIGLCRFLLLCPGLCYRVAGECLAVIKSGYMSHSANMLHEVRINTNTLLPSTNVSYGLILYKQSFRDFHFRPWRTISGSPVTCWTGWRTCGKISITMTLLTTLPGPRRGWIFTQKSRRRSTRYQWRVSTPWGRDCFKGNHCHWYHLIILIWETILARPAYRSLICLQYSLFGVLTFRSSRCSQWTLIDFWLISTDLQAFNVWEWQQLRQRLQWEGQHGQQHDSQPRPPGQHPQHHAAPGPDPLRPAAAPPALAAQEKQTGPMSPAEDVWTRLWKGKTRCIHYFIISLITWASNTVGRGDGVL